MSLSPQFLDELRARTLLSALVGKTVKLTRAGREWRACCPFHDEKTPSFYVNDAKGFYHCLAAETRVVTSKGRVPIGSLAGQSVRVLTRGGRWVDSRFDAYGLQQLWRIELSRNRVRKTLFATAKHRWFVHDRANERTTDTLRPGHALESVRPLQLADWTVDPEGVRHGIVFGDGTLCKEHYGLVNLHGGKDLNLLAWFPAARQAMRERAGGKTFVRIYGGRSFGGMKALPALDAPRAYLLGFLAGYLAADGHVAKDGTVMLNSANADHLEGVRDIAMAVGITTFGRTTLMRKGFGTTESALHRIHFLSSDLTAELFLLPEARERFAGAVKKFERLRWVVRSVEPSDRVETVYCAEVPGEHAFALDDNILTGNCFGCSAHGDAIRWLTDQRGLPFMDAVKELANAASLELPAPDPREAQRQERAAGLHDAMAAAEAWFIEQLNGVEGGEARAYLKKRGISPELAQKFGIGLAPGSRGRLRSALSKFGDPMLVEAGLLIAIDDKEPYDRFRGRVMIPIRDPRGRTIGFGGRILGAGEPKYLNSPDTPLFDKGRTLWNLDKAAGASRKAGRLIVVEGYMDAIALAGAGIEEVVAPNGTALTEHQIERLWRVIDVPVVCFDGDSAGQKAAARAAHRALPILRPGCSLDFATLPPGQDPDDLVRAGGAAAFEPVIAGAEPMIERLWTSEQAATSVATPEARAGLKQRLDALVDTIGDFEVRRHYQRQLKERFDERFFARREFIPRGQFQPRGKPIAGPASPSAQAIHGRGIEPLYERPVMAGLIRHPSIVLACAETLGILRFTDQRLDSLRAALVDAAYDGDLVDSAQLDPICAAAGLTDMLAELRAMNGRRGMAFSFLKRSTPEEAARRDLAMTIEAVAARPEIDQALQAATGRVGMGGGEDCFEEQLRLLRAKHENEQQMRLLLGQDDGI